MSKQDEQDEKARASLLRLTVGEIRELLSNIDGLRRLRAITDEEWQEAEAEGEQDGP